MRAKERVGRRYSVTPISVIVSAEDRLLAALGERLLRAFDQKYCICGKSLVLNGKTNINQRVPKWNNSARNGNIHLVLRDLDSLAGANENCPVNEIARLCRNQNRHSNLMLRFAVVESESWLLADDRALASFLRFPLMPIHGSADQIPDPKNDLLSWIRRRSRDDKIRKGMLPRDGGTAKIGIDYNDILAEFVANKWSPNRAAKKSESLRRALYCLRDFRPAPRP